MIARNLKAGKYASGIINYAFEGRELEHKDKGAEVLRYSSDLLVPFSAADKEGIKELTKQFNERTSKYLQANPENKNSLIGHQILSFTKEDEKKLSRTGMERVLDDYIKHAKLEKTQFIAVSHKDTNNFHIHIVYHKVQNNMKKENDWRLNNKTAERGVALALKEKLTLIKKQKDVALTKGVLEIRAKDSDIIKMRNDSELLKGIKNQHHFDKVLEAKGITKDYANDGRVIIDKKLYRNEDLQAVFYLNRSEKVEKEPKQKFVKESPVISPFKEMTEKVKDVKSAIKSFQFVTAASDDSAMPTFTKFEKSFQIATAQADREMQPSKRKRRGKSYLMKNKGAKSNTKTKGQQL